MSGDGDKSSMENLRAWAEGLCEELARRLVTRNILKQSARVETRWVLPGRIIIGVAEEKEGKGRRMWVIGGEAVSADAVDIDVARNPREVARHFSLRWQLSGARMGNAAGDGEGEQGQVDWKGMEERLTRQAELLHQIAEDDKAWEGTQDEPGAGKKVQ